MQTNPLQTSTPKNLSLFPFIYSSPSYPHTQLTPKEKQKTLKSPNHKPKKIKMQTMVKKTEMNQPVGEKKVKDLMGEKKRLVEVPYTASLAHTMNVLVANHVVAVPVAAPPGHWIGAGGSMIMESDKRTGALRKHYIGMITMLDVLAHIAGDDEDDQNGGGDLIDLERKMAVPVSSVIGHNVEGLSLWTLYPNTRLC